MKKLAIIGANSFQNKLINKAKSMGYETHVFAWQVGDVGEKNADFFYPISIIEKQEILEKCREIDIDGICSIASDLAAPTVNYVARQLGLVGNSERCDIVATNKYEMRNALEQFGIRTPLHKKVTDNTREQVSPMDFTYPVIVKPTDRSGSRGITKVEQLEGLEEAITNSIEQSFEKAAIIEEYIEGREYSCECISYKGQHNMLAITEKYTTGAPMFIEVGHIEPAKLNENIYQKIEVEVFRALDALDIKNGASHTEFKLNDKNEISIIEIGARMGGDCIGSDLVHLSTGNDYVKMVIDIAMGKRPEIASGVNRECYAGIRFIMQPEDRKFLKQQYERVNVYEIDVETEDNTEVRDSSTRYGYIIGTSDNYEKLKSEFELEVVQ